MASIFRAEEISSVKTSKQAGGMQNFATILQRKEGEVSDGKNWTTLSILLSLLVHTELRCTKPTVRGGRKS
jgi:hypothetical protein